MSCLHKRPERSEEEERAFQEHAKKVAQENGKRLGKSLPTPSQWVYAPGISDSTIKATRVCA